MWVSLPITNNDDCQWSIGSENVVTDKMICAGDIFESERDACQVSCVPTEVIVAEVENNVMSRKWLVFCLVNTLAFG